jgi:hypothetical protein
LLNQPPGAKHTNKSPATMASVVSPNHFSQIHKSSTAGISHGYLRNLALKRKRSYDRS